MARLPAKLGCCKTLGSNPYLGIKGRRGGKSRENEAIILTILYSFEPLVIAIVVVYSVKESSEIMLSSSRVPNGQKPASPPNAENEKPSREPHPSGAAMQMILPNSFQPMQRFVAVYF